MKKGKAKNWVKVNILKSQAVEIKKILQEGDFANVSQFVVFVIRTELYFRKQSQSTKNTTIVNEKEIKATLEKWIDELKKQGELEGKLRKAFENDKSHTQTLSMLT